MRLLVAVMFVAWLSLDAGCASWTKEQNELWALNIGCHAADAALTAHAVQDDSGRYQESNPLYGSHPSGALIVGAKIVGVGLEGLIIDDYIEPEHRTAALIAMDFIQCAVVGWNYRVTH